MSRWRSSYHLYAMITIVGWGLAFVFTRLALQELHYTTVGLLRNGIASIALIIMLFFIKVQLFDKKDLKGFILSGTCGFFLFMLTFNKGAQTVTAATSSVIMATVPIITALIASIFYKEKLRWFQWGAIALQFWGIYLLAGGVKNLNANTGILWLLLASFCLSVYNIFQKQLTKKYTSLQVSVYSIFLGTVPFLYFLPASYPEIISMNLVTGLVILTMGVFSSAIAYVSWAKAFSLAENTSQVSNYMFVTPLLATVFGVFILNEIPDKNFLVSSIIILLGLLLFNKGSLIFDRNKL